MAKRFKLRISRVISSFQSCRSKDPSSLPEDPVPSYVRPNLIASADFPVAKSAPATKPRQPHRSSFKRHVSSAFISVGCGNRSKRAGEVGGGTSDDDFAWQKEEKWHVVAKVYEESPRRKIFNSSASGESDSDIGVALPPLPPPPSEEKKKRRGRKKKKTGGRIRISTSSADSILFSSEGGDERENDDVEEEETETLVSSSRSFSTDSSMTRPPRHPKKKHKKKVKRPKRCVSKGMCRPSISSPECQSPARLSMFKKLIPCTVDGKVKESFAVVKKSEDPYEDFKRSMTEMILEKQMFDERDLEQLLQCFLSLNSRNHHRVIVEVFSEIWDAMFCASRIPTSQRRRFIASM